MVDHLDPPQVLDLMDPFEARHHQAQWIALLRTQRLAIHAIAHETVVESFCERNGRRALHFLRPFRNDPGRPVLYAGFLEQERERHAGPFGAARQPVRFLHCLGIRVRTVSKALDKMNARDVREALQFVHAERQRAVHHAVNHQAMLMRIDVGHKRAAMRRRVEQRRWRDDPDRILKRRQDVKRQPEGIGRRSVAHRHADRVLERRALAVGDQLLDVFFRGCRRCRPRGWRLGACWTDRSRGQPAGQDGAIS